MTDTWPVDWDAWYDRDDHTAILHARCEDVLPHIAAQSVDLIITDPPYFRVKAETWDRQWPSETAYLAWLGDLCQQWQRILKPNGSLYLFASPEMAAPVEMVLRQTFTVEATLCHKGRDVR
jgi:site-specific DNA-methyltransferase (adenine-specific)